MKKIALPSAFSSVSSVTVINKVTVKAVSIFTLLLVQILPGRAQQVIGSFPEMEGGFTNVLTMDTSNATVAAGYQLTRWRGAGSTTTSIYTSNIRTGVHSLQWLTGSSSQVLKEC
jgi:hypothetical protein